LIPRGQPFDDVPASAIKTPMAFLQHLFSSQPPEGHQKLLTDLEALGFFRYTKPEDLEALQNAILQQGWSGVFGESGRLFFADAEDLAEGGVAGFLSEVTPFLEEQEVEVPAIEDNFGETYILMAGEEKIPIWTREESQRELAGEPGLRWGLSAARTVQILNDWLERAESGERAYGVNGGNDFMVFFLTSEIYSRIRQDPGASAEHGPYVPDQGYPSFGQPH
jgi:hypothetical protein